MQNLPSVYTYLSYLRRIYYTEGTARSCSVTTTLAKQV